MATPLRALTTFGWGQRMVREGDIVSSDDPVVRKNAALFEPILAPVVEQATAAPGERRTVTRPRKET
jgi:hypothetical protein